MRVEIWSRTRGCIEVLDYWTSIAAMGDDIPSKGSLLAQQHAARGFGGHTKGHVTGRDDGKPAKRVQPRNAPCVCGSGKKAKRCHVYYPDQSPAT